MKTYSSYVNFLCSLMAIDIPDICYCFKEQYYDVHGFGVEPFEMESHCKSHLIQDENRIYINLNEMHGENDIYCILAHEIRLVHNTRLQKGLDWLILHCRKRFINGKENLVDIIQVLIMNLARR